VLAGTVPDTVRYLLDGTRAGRGVGQRFRLVAHSVSGGMAATDTLVALQETSGDGSGTTGPEGERRRSRPD
jgi:hypothetical protein